MILGILPRAMPGGIRAVGIPVVGFCLLIFLASPALAATLTGIRHSSSAERTRVVIDLSAKASYTHRVLADPARVVIDLPGSGVDAGVSARSINNGFVKQVRLNELRDGRVQVVVDLTKVLDYSIFTLDNPSRVVVDVKHPEGTPPAAKPAPVEPKPVAKETAPETAKKTEPAKKEEPKPAAKETRKEPEPAKAEARKATTSTPTPAPRQTEKRQEQKPPPVKITPPPNGEWIIAIDAGHGGEDHGARHHDTSEKDITLALAKELKKDLEAKGNIRVILVRKGDYFIPLRRRWTLAEKQGAHLFVSIHCNASKNRKAEGTEVYFLSLKGATDEAAQDLAHRENAVDQKMGVSVPEDDLNQIIFDMMQTDVLTKSQFLAESCLDHLYELGTVYNRGVKQAGFAVLKSPRMPSILVEAAFLSNRKENKMLRDASWRRQFSDHMADGIVTYIQSVDPAMKAER